MSVRIFMSDAEAIIFLIDNSERSVNGDFAPTRLDAQKMAVERLSQYYYRLSAKTEIGLGTEAQGQFGIIGSLTTRKERLKQTVDSIKIGGKANLGIAIRCGLLALRHKDPDLINGRMVAFISSDNDMTMESADRLSEMCNEEKVAVDVVSFGPDVPNKDAIGYFVGRLKKTSYFIDVPATSEMLADFLLQSQLGPGSKATSQNLDDENDPDLRAAIRLSMEESHSTRDKELDEAIKLSLREAGITDEEQDPDLAEAIRLSMEDQDTAPKTDEEKTDEDKEETDEDKEKKTDDGKK